jgi:tryptophan synthase alpha chain
MPASVSERFATLRARGECALIPFLTAGDPDLATTERALLTLAANGADAIELGVPYSDPLADGPTIQAAATRALQKGVTLDNVIDLVARVSPQIEVPIVLFTYYNPILNRGIETFLKQIAAAGAKGLVVPDLPLEEADGLLATAATIGIEVTLLVAPTSPIDRIERIASQSQGFIYLVSVTGVTGARSEMSHRVPEVLARLRSVSDRPVGVGFGVSTPTHAQQLKAWGVDAAIVGSAMVKCLSENGVDALGAYTLSLKQALND